MAYSLAVSGNWLPGTSRCPDRCPGGQPTTDAQRRQAFSECIPYWPKQLL